MILEQFRDVWRAQPFKPFVIHLADGREIPVVSPEFVLSVPGGRTIVVCQPDSTLNIIDLLLVTDLEFKPATNGGTSKRRRR
jgi:hypothetical protein